MGNGIQDMVKDDKHYGPMTKIIIFLKKNLTLLISPAYHLIFSPLEPPKPHPPRVAPRVAMNAPGAARGSPKAASPDLGLQGRRLMRP